MAAESQFQEKVQQYLENDGAYQVKYWAGAAFTKKGIPDLLVCSDGWFMGIELKAPDGKPSLLQIINLRKIREAGGYGILLYPKDFGKFKVFNQNKSHFNAWYLDNIELQMHWENKLKGE